MIAWFLVSFALAQSPCESITSISPEYAKLSEQAQKRMEQAPDLAVIAEEADSVLSRLSQTKSPVLMSWLEKRNLSEAKEEEMAKQWRTYYFNDYILANFPTSNEKVNQAVVGLFSDLNKLYYPNAFRKKMQALFEKAQKGLVGRLKAWPLSESQRLSLIQKIEQLSISWADNIAESPFAKEPKAYLESAFRFNKSQDRITMGALARQLPSDANYFAIFVHEMAHLFDPCFWSQQKETPFQSIVTCLRTEKSVGAKKVELGFLNKAGLGPAMTPEQVKFYQAHPLCLDTPLQSQSSQVEQINEVFADWVSAEVTAHSSFLGQHPRPDLCHSDLGTSTAFVPNALRLQKIYFANPQLAGALKLKPSAYYCHF